MLNKIARLVGAFFITLVVLLLMLFIVLTAMEYRPESTEKVRIDSLAEDTFDSPEVGSTIKVMSWNIGYGALGDNADFFMDGGSQVTTASAERVQENMQGIIDELKSQKADVMFLQEVDRFSTRAHHTDEQQDIAESMDGYQSTFANNFKVRYVPYPWPPIGRVDSGIMTLSRFAQSDSTRISLPCPFEWPVRIANLKRCLMVNRVPIAGTKKELVMINLHLEAYDNGEGKVKQTKALLKVKGEVLIEREIRQLQAAGIDDITVVVGYMKEKLFYLEDRFHVKIVINEDYHRYNNPSTLMLVRDRLKNTFICSSDNYFEQNPFEPYVYQAYYASLYSAGKTDEYCMVTNRKGRITGVQVGGSDAWYMFGHVYFDRSFSEKFTQILEREYDSPVTRAGLWEDLYARHISELEMYIRKYPGGIHEFDSLDELRAFDSAYVTNTDSYIFDNICAVLHCTPDSIHGIIPIKTGLTNLSFKFTCNGRDYVYRHPGAGTEAYIDRPAEARALEVAKALGLDDTFLYIDAAKGWKISHYIEDAAILDYHNTEQVDTALRMLRRLHTSGIQLDGRFDIWEKINGFLDLLQGTDVSDFTGMQELHETMCALHERLKGDAVPLCACHCDSYNPNFLIDKQGKMYLIDWEYAGMADPGCDIGTFIACSDYTPEEAEQVIARYLGHAPTGAELRHYIGYVAMASYFWFLWGLYQEACAKHVGEYLYIWYKYTKQYARLTLERYDHEEEFA